MNMNNSCEIDPTTGLPKATLSYDYSHFNSWDRQYHLNHNLNLFHRKRALSDVDLTQELKKLRLDLTTDCQQSLSELDDVNKIEEPCFSQELQEHRIYIDDSYLELTNRLPSILLRPSPSVEAEYLRNRQLILYRPFIWTILFDQLFKSLESSDTGFEPMDCDEFLCINFQETTEEPMECEDDYYGEPMEID